MSTQVTTTSSSLSEGWAKTVRSLLGCPKRKAFHTVTVMTDPTSEDPDLRAGLDRLLARHHMQPVVEVANTVFPQALAETSTDAYHLGRRYRAIYPRLRQLDRDNVSGTYFGRLVQYPASRGSVDQFAEVVARMKVQRAAGAAGVRKGVMGAAYETTLHEPGDAVAYLATQVPGTDHRYRGFPCLTGLSFQLIDDQVHLLAQYRYEYLFAKGYGNYLGLSQMMTFVADEVGVLPGQLTVVTGRAHVDLTAKHIGPLIDGFVLDV
ncbi:hypothetical protein [Humibacillus xanthopallidus]|uniref:Thymidylate synthase n=1 Tax=Humibacillus xanthopallidus TaxID=412689 RepID=A0A543HHP4_9MICO|nr:hypothetical protein [Humibacillus xanthopallidus]TQM57850.1 hypothetical protein FBY41_3186 [Humibacillus xanthopallidus]